MQQQGPGSRAAVATIRLPSQPFGIDFHPNRSLIAAGLISGALHLYSFEESSTARLWTRKKAHSESCRAARFIDGGQYIVSCSADGSLVASNVETGKRATRVLHAHSAAVNCLAVMSDHMLASGDDSGNIKVWDIRDGGRTCAASFPATHDDYVADMEYSERTQHLLAVSGDGKLSVTNMRRNRVESVSEHAEDELLTVTMLKHGSKVVCGSQTGVLLLYSWPHVTDCSDRYPGHPTSIDAALKLDEDRLLTASSDGIIREVSVLPNAMLGVVGSHEHNFPIEALAISLDHTMLASASHDKTVKLWNISDLADEGEEEEEEKEEEEEEEEDKQDKDAKETAEGNNGHDRDPENGFDQEIKRNQKKQKLQTKSNPDFFADL